MFELKNVDVKLLREQREALFCSIEDVGDIIEDLTCYGTDDSIADAIRVRQQQIGRIEGLVNMIDDMLDAIELTSPIQPAQHPLWEGVE